jgi:hypothetical protein
MFHTIVVESPSDSRVMSSKVLDESVWRTWLKKNRLQELHRTALRMRALKWACTAMLAVTAVVSPYVFTPYTSAFQTVVRFAVAVGAIVLIVESLRRGRYVFAGLFAGIVLLFNPVLPALDLSGNRLIIVISALPFLASLIWVKEKVRLAAALV